MNILTMGYILIPFIIILCFQKLGTAAYVLAFASSLTTLAVFSIGDNFISLYLLLFAVVFIKYCASYCSAGTRRLRLNLLPKALVLYFVWCAISTVQAAFPWNHTIIVTGLDATDYLAFRPSQFTQLIYLLISILFCWIMTDLLDRGILSRQKLWKVLCAAYVVAVLLVYVHALIPKEWSILLFRNGKVDAWNQTGTVCGAFFEPSTMACYICPFVCVFLEKFLRSGKCKPLLLSVMGLATFLLSGSTSAWFGLLFWLVFSLIRGVIRIIKGRHVRVNRMRIIAPAFLLIAVLTVAVLCWPLVSRELGKLGLKLASLSQPNDVMTHGERGGIFWLNWKAFLHSPLTGLGFGAVRSADLFTTILAGTGIIGFVLYLAYWVPGCVRLSKNSENDGLVTFIVVYNAIMLVAVPEPYYLTIWAMYALMYPGLTVSMPPD